MDRHLFRFFQRLCVYWAVSCSAICRAAEPPKPLQVFILAGQSNMEGQAVSDLEGKDYNGGKGTLNFLLRDPEKAPRLAHLKSTDGKWPVRDDVWCHYKRERGPLLAGPLSMGFSVYGDSHHFGPELQFGCVIGDYLDNQVLLIKTAWGGKSLYVDFRPPSAGGEVGPYYKKMLAEVAEALANLKTDFPTYDEAAGYELAGFVWYQGWNDGVDPKRAVPEYEQNLVHLINDVRRDLKSPKLPVVVGELTGPWVDAPGEWKTLREAQAKAAARPEFKGNVVFVPTHEFVRKAEDSPNPTHGHHEFGNAETYFLVGDALGRGMKSLLPPRTIPGLKTSRTIDAPEAHQAAAADAKFVYAIDSTKIAKYDRASGKRLATSKGDAKHLNSGFFWEGKLYCAHSNYPRTPEQSEIKVLDPETMELTDYHSFGNFGGSLTWCVREGGHWWCNFARYGQRNEETFLVKLDDEWKELGRWTYPPNVIRELGNNSLSGGIWQGDELLVTGHDDPILFRLKLPREGSVLELVAKQGVPFSGQGFAADPATGGLVGIDRNKHQIVFAEAAKK
jgi:hypothetical protein